MYLSLCEGKSTSIENSLFCRLIIPVSLAISNVHGLEMTRRCILPDIPHNQNPASLPENTDHHSLNDRGLSSQDVPNRLCKQRYIVPVLWHVISDSSKNGDVSDATLQRQIDILNGNLMSIIQFNFK
jgi:hypothetical protein